MVFFKKVFLIFWIKKMARFFRSSNLFNFLRKVYLLGAKKIHHLSAVDF